MSNNELRINIEPNAYFIVIENYLNNPEVDTIYIKETYSLEPGETVIAKISGEALESLKKALKITQTVNIRGVE